MYKYNRQYIITGIKNKITQKLTYLYKLDKTVISKQTYLYRIRGKKKKLARSKQP